jgi:hypothetical protein
MVTHSLEKPIRVGIFGTIGQADRAVRKLLEAGFTKEQISVLCSDKYTEAHFRAYEHQDPAGTHTAANAAAGSAIGMLLGGTAAVAGFLTTGGIGLLVGGAMLALSGGVAGGLVGAMVTRGVERELADYYDQAVTRGKILVAAEDTTPDAAISLAKADQILHEAGAEPIELDEQ